MRLLAAAIGVMLYASGATAQPAPSLGSAASFAVLGGSGVVNSGPTRVTGDVGVSPGSSIRGFPPGTVIVGGTFFDDATARQAKRDSAAANATLATLPCTQLSSAAPAPGVYCVTSLPPSPLTLAGDANSWWVFRSAGSLTPPANFTVLLRGGATNNNVFWQVGGSMTVGTGSSFVGTIFAHDNITLEHTVALSGHAVAETGTVTLDTDDLTCCGPIELTPPSLPDGRVNEPYKQTIAGSTGTAPYTFSVFDGTLPPGLTLAPDGTLSGTPSTAGTYTFTVLAIDAHGCSTIHTYTITICGIVVTFDPKPDAKACEFFERTIGVKGGTPPYVFNVKGLPDGLSNQDNVISGTPTASAPGDHIVTIDVTDAHCKGTLTVTLHVLCGLMLPPLNPSTATVGVRYTANITPSCGKPPFAFTATGLPTWLPPPKSDGVLTGIPPEPGDIPFTVTVTDDAKCADTKPYILHVVCPPIAVLPPIVLPTGFVCTPYDFGPIAGTVVDPASLPPGLIVNGRLQGVPKKSGKFRFTMTFDNVSPTPPCPTPTQDYVITIDCPMLTLPPLDPPLRGCVPMSQSLVPAFCLPFTCSASTLPSGLALDNCVLHGTPQPGDYDFTVVAVAGDSGCGVTARYTGSVPPCNDCNGSLTLSPASTALPPGTVGVSYSQMFVASGGMPSYTYVVVVPPSPPPGLALNPATGILAGIPTTPGHFNFAVKATDTVGACKSFVYTIDVGPIPPPPPPIPALSAWAMLLLGMALAFGAVVVIRRSS